MNKILSVFAAAAALALCSCGTMQQRGNYAAPSTGKVSQHVNATSTKIKEAQTSVTKAQASAKKVKEQAAKIVAAAPKTPENEALFKPFQTEIDNLTNELITTQAALQDAQQETAQAQAAIPPLQEQINQQTQQLNDQVGKTNAAIKERDMARKSYHKLKFWIIGVAAGATVFLLYALFHAAIFVPPLLYLTIAAPAAVSTFLLFYL